MHRVVVLLAAVGVAIPALMPIAGRAQQGPSMPFVAVFEMQNDGSPLPPDAVSRMGNYLFTNLAACGAYRLVPQDQVRERLARQKTESYRECYDQTCQIELSREMAADKALSSSVTKVGSVCQVSASLYDLTTAAIDRAAVAEGPCTEEGVRGAILTVVARLCGGGTGQQPAIAPGPGPVAPPPTWDHQGTTAVVPDLPAVAEERGVLRVEGTPGIARVDVTGPRGFGTNGSLATKLPYGPATVPAGEYRVKVSAPDHDADTRTVMVYADRTALMEVALVPSQGVLELWGTPAGAKVELTCPKGFSRTFGLPGKATSIPVPRGSCRVQVARNGYQSFDRSVEVKGGGTTAVPVRMVEIDAPVASDRGAIPGKRPDVRRDRAVRVSITLSFSEGFVRFSDSTYRTNVGMGQDLGLRFRGAPWLVPGLGLWWTVEKPAVVSLRPGIQWYFGSFPMYLRTALSGVLAPKAAAVFVAGLGGDIPLWQGGFLALEMMASVWSAQLVPVEFRLGIGHAF
jgi:hypothetical protein